MRSIPWEPMPETEELTLQSPKQAASVRAAYRRRMALRWRSIAARREDKAAGRLPAEWHDWMGCPGYEGYGGPLCTCDSWGKCARRHSSRLPVSVPPKRSAIVIGQRLPQNLCGAEYIYFIEGIDCFGVLPIVPAHAIDVPRALARACTLVAFSRRSQFRKRPASRHIERGSGRRLVPTHQPAWLRGIGGRLSRLRRGSGRAG